MNIYEKIKNGDYESKLHYPSYEEEKEAIKKVEETFVGTMTQIKDEIDRVQAGIDEKRTAYKNDNYHLEHCVFKKDLMRECGVENNPKAERAWEMAWDRSSGLESTAQEFEELVELIR